jgi:hypothetical protein
MASVQSNPGWALGYVPTPDEWANAFSGKQDALLSNMSVIANSTVLNTCCKLTVDTSAGDVVITVDPLLGTLLEQNTVRIVKRSITPNSNTVYITPDGVLANAVATITTENGSVGANGAGFMIVDSNGSTIEAYGVS